MTQPSGGLLSSGHPLGATILAQCAELVWQRRCEAGARQVEDPSIALGHNIRLVGAAIVTLYEKPGRRWQPVRPVGGEPVCSDDGQATLELALPTRMAQ